MLNSLRERYKIEKSNVEKSYEYQLSLKNNEEYEKRVDDTFMEFANLFKTIYSNVKIEPPRGREKSKRSLKNKIKKLEIERLCKLYAIEGISEEEKESLYNLILDSVKNTKQEAIRRIFSKEIKNLKEIDKIVQDKEIDDHIKTALLRVTKIRLQNENVENSEEFQEILEKKYGETAARETNQLKNNLLHWELIENMNEEEINKLHCPFEYLKAKDLRAFKFVIADVPDDVQTNSETLKALIQKRKEAPEEEKLKYSDFCCITLAKEFTNILINSENLLEKLNIQVLQDGYKHKQKQNGYIAEHIKFCYRDHPEYTFEFQLRSIYREDLSRANGKAAHDKRSGKKRIFPSIANKNKFIEELKDVLPSYRMLEYNDGKFNLHKCDMEENLLGYYLEYVKLDSKEYEKAIEYIREDEQTQK